MATQQRCVVLEDAESRQLLAQGPHGDDAAGAQPRAATRARRALAAAAASAAIGAALCMAAAALLRGPTSAADAEAVAGLVAEPAGALNGDAVPFNNIRLALKGYNIYYADPAPLPGSGEATWQYTKHGGKYLGGYAAGDSKTRGIEASEQRCTELGDKCGGCTCASPQSCTVRASKELKDSPSGEVSYLKKKVVATVAPDGDADMKLNMDPGLRKPVFALEYTRGGLTGDRRHTKPDGYHATVDMGCSTIFTSKSIRDSYELTKETSNEISLTAGVEASVGVSACFPPSDEESGSSGDDDGGIEVGATVEASVSAGATGTLSHKDQEIRNENELRDQRMERSVAKCASYVAAIEYGNFPKTHPDFQKAVDALGGSAEKYWDLFDDFGTHFLTTIKMGARYSVTSYFRNDQYDTMTKKIKGFGVSVGVSASASAGVSVGVGPVGKGVSVDAGVDASADLLCPKEKKAFDTMKTYIQKQETSAMGPVLDAAGLATWVDAVNDSPVPIRFDKREICLHPVFKGDAQTTCKQHLKGYCEGRLKPKGAPCQDMAKRECMNDLECSQDHLCRAFKCKPAPICTVTLCAGPLHACGASYTLPKITHAKAAAGRTYDLINGDWWDRVSSLKLSDGCEKVEAVDDDGSCRFGKADNRHYRSSANLPYDLDNDVCMIKVFAKDLPGGAGLRRLSAALSNGTSGAVLPVPEEIPGLAEVNALLAERQRRRRGAELAGAPGPRWPEDAAPMDHLRAVRGAHAKLRRAAMRGAASNHSVARRLAAETADTSKFVRNVGKAMYGYNHYFGAPLSAEYAGTDPGFQHRSMWAVTYMAGAVASHKEFTEIPKGKPSASGPTTGGPDPNSPKPQWLNVRGLPTSQSSTASGGASQRAVDGNDFAEWSGGSCTHTSEQDSPWWEVDLGRLYDISTVKVVNREDCCSDRLNPFDIIVDGKICAAQVPIGKEAKEVKCEAVGRRLKIASRKRTALTLCEVKVLAAEAGDLSPHFCVVSGGKVHDAFCDIEEAKTKLKSVATGSRMICEVSRGQAKADPHQVGGQNQGGGTSAGFDKWWSGWAGINDMNAACEAADICVQKECVAFAFSRHAGFYLGGYASGDSRVRSVEAAKERCKELGAPCGGITCNPAETQCTVRASQELKPSPTNEVSYKSGGGRRLTAAGERGVASSSLVAGPPRMLADSELKVPDGWKVTMGTSVYCEKNFNSKAIKSNFAYKNEMKDSFSLGGIDIGFASFDYSSESREFVDRSGKEGKMLVTTKAECIDYLLEIEDLQNKPPPTDPSFQFVVQAAANEADFYVLFDMFGLHFPSAVVFGSRYGFTRYIDEQNYKNLAETSDSETVTASVSYTVGVDKGAASAGITASLEASGTVTTSAKTVQNVKKYFEEVREFSVGKRMPDEGGFEAWTKDAAEEPMPIKFDLTSICEHPAFDDKKQDCLKYSKTYCADHLTKFGEVNCDAPPEPECLWDLDCKAHHTCGEGSCVPEPACYVTVYKNRNLGGSSIRYGPIYHRERPVGEVFSLGWMEDEISSLKISGGCEEVILMDEDKCREVYSDNGVVDLRTHNNEVVKSSLVNDLDNDVCRVKVLAKEKWVK